MRQLYALLWKDFLLDYRNPIGVSVIGTFSLTAGVVVGLVYRSSVWPPESLLSVSLPLVLVFLSIFTVYASFIRESDTGTLDGLRLSPVEPGLLMVAKTIYSTLLIVISSAIFTLSALFFSGGTSAPLGDMFAWLAVSSLYLGTVSSMVSAMLVYSEARSGLAPALIIVFLAPFVNVASAPLNQVLSGYAPAPGWASALLGLSLGFLVIGYMLSRFLVE